MMNGMSSLTRVPSLEQLLALTSTAAYGSMGVAATHLGVSQQAISSRIRAAEKVLGVAVFERTSLGVRPTGSGQLVLAWADEVVQAAGVLEEGALGLRSSPEQILVAASSTISEVLLPTWASRLRQKHPGVALQVVPGNSDAVVAAVTRGEVHLGFVERPKVPRTVRSRAVAHDELIVVAPPDHPWARRRHGIDRVDLAAARLILREDGSGTRSHFDQEMPEHTPPLQTLASNAAVRDAARATGAATVLSSLAVANDLQAGRLVHIPVSGFSLRRTLRVIWHPNQRPQGPAADLLHLCTRPA